MSGPKPPAAPPPPSRFTPIPFAPTKQGGQLRGNTHGAVGAINQAHAAGIISNDTIKRIDAALKEEKHGVTTRQKPPDMVFKETYKRPNEHFPWEQPKVVTAAELDGTFPQIFKDKGYANAKVPVPDRLVKTGEAYSKPGVKKKLEKTFYDKHNAEQKKIQDQIPPLQKGPYSPVDLRTAFDVMDFEKNGLLTKANLRQVLAQCGHAASETELHNMIMMASSMINDNKEDVVDWENFQEMFINPKLVFQRVDLSRIIEIDAWEVGGAVDLYRAAGESADVRVVEGGVEIGIPKKNRNLVLDYLTTGGQTSLKPSDLKRFYKEFQALDTSGENELTYKQFLQLLGAKESERTEALFSFFDVDDGGTVSLKEFIIGLTNFTNAQPEERMKFAFKLYDEDNSESIDADELKSLIIANFAVAGKLHDHEIEQKMENVYASCNVDYGHRLDLGLFMACARKNPMLFQPLPLASEEMEAQMVKEGRMRDD